ncbi:Universal stress protein [Mycobacterium talmoniae]|uniref:Universal stress protein n=1 Tax=Mycobacterium talmoniae TaxID=1858794 RepID=A0A2S8BPD0_9MYCO|nr:Universal stress protein [Mycobacterium talmoniae]
MSAYQTVVVGTDGSDSSLRAVDRAGALASGPGAKLIVATAYLPGADDPRASDMLKDEGYKTSGNAPIYAILREASERAHAAGAASVEERSVVGPRWMRWWTWPKRSRRTCWWSATSA